MSNRSEKRREARNQSSGGGNRMLWVFGGVAVVAIAIFGYTMGAGSSGAAVTSPIEVEGLGDPETLVEMAQGVTLGQADAPITLVEFGDYQCPGCRSFATSVKPQIELGLVQSGEAKFVFYDFPLVSIHPHAFLAARAARCAGDQGMFWEYHTEIFNNQSTWSSKQSVVGDFVDYAGNVGADTDAFDSCLKSDRHAATVTANMRLGEELGITGTPTVMVSRGEGMARRLSSFDYATIQDVVQGLQEEAAGEGSGDTGQGGS